MALSDNPILAIIPARGGSKELPSKNMLKVKETPLVGYSLYSALNSKYISDVYLTSDDEITLLYGQEVGVTVVRRPEECSSDTATASNVVKHFMSTISEKLIEKDPYVIYLQPTSPLRTAAHIDDAFERMVEAGLHRLISVVRMEKTPFKAFILDENGNLEVLFKENMTNKRRQDLPQAYLPNGAIYIFRLSDFRQNDEFPSNGSYPYIMSELDSLDIDSKNDLEIFSQILEKNNMISNRNNNK